MRYISTRGQSPPVSFLDAVLAGMAPDGGLYVPESWPRTLDSDDIRRRAAYQPYQMIAAEVLVAFAGADLHIEEARTLCQDAYLRNETRPTWPALVTPLVQVFPGRWVLELFHGPSLSFKDVAMQLIAPLYDLALARTNRRLNVVCATSGDTGGAAVEALKGNARSDLFVLLPKGRVSDVQRRFMTTSGSDNVHALEIDGDFDACQAILKAMFADADFANRAALSGVNSINWARIVAQSVYYHLAANVLGGVPDFAVPTGNFGDAFSGYVAKRTGAPIGAVILATNANDILPRAIETGWYRRAPQSVPTVAPAMDIQVASNFERVLFEALDRDSDQLRRLYTQFAQSGEFEIPSQALSRLRAEFEAVALDDEAAMQSMRDWRYEGYLACPHTAIGLAALDTMEVGQCAPIVTLATAHPAKFPDTVERATGVRPKLPAKCADLFERAEKFDSLPADVEAVKHYIRERSRAWQ